MWPASEAMADDGSVQLALRVVTVENGTAAHAAGDAHGEDVADYLGDADTYAARLAALDAGILELETYLRRMLDLLQEIELECGGGELAGAGPAPAAGLEKRTFRGDGGDGAAAGATGCAVCLEDFEEGEEVSAMPCSRGHEFHSICIAKWLGRSNTCPLCRHALPLLVTHDNQ
ncbi:hypothetical protein ACP4OV_003683 [Aristida adscensionis]